MSLAEAVRIWTAGVQSVAGNRLIDDQVLVGDDGHLTIEHWRVDLRDLDRCLIVGGGKAAGPMATTLATKIAKHLPVRGRVNVVGSTDQSVEGVEIIGCRPIGSNHPTERVVESTGEMLSLLDRADNRTLVLFVVTGGGSSLLCRPRRGVSLADYVLQTAALSDAGADIAAINRLRCTLDTVKGGGMARRLRSGGGADCPAAVLLISDVVGDALPVIASGPVLDPDVSPSRRIPHFVLGNNAVAVDEAGIMAESMGRNHLMHCVTGEPTTADQTGIALARLMRSLHDQGNARRHDAVITGGEPTVVLCPPDVRGRGGRNGQLVLAAYVELIRGLGGDGRQTSDRMIPDMTILSGGTDGEDGTSDSAGAGFDRTIHHRIIESAMDPIDYLRRNDSHRFFDRVGGLIRTGPTGTNVCDVRVGLVGPEVPG